MPRFPVTAGAGMDVLDKIGGMGVFKITNHQCAGMDAVRRVRTIPADVLGKGVSFSSWIAGAGMIVVRRFGEYAIVRAASYSSSSIDPVASLLADLSPPYSSIPSVASLPAVLFPHLIQRLSSEVSIGTACVQASHPSTRAYTLAAGLCSQSLPRRSSTYHHHVSYRGFSSGNAEYATKAEVSGNAEYATKAEVVKLEHKLDLVKREFESMIELVKQEKKQIETLFDAHKLKTKADVMAVQNSVLKTYATVVSTVVTIVLGGIAIYEFQKHFGSTKNNAMTTDEQK